MNQKQKEELNNINKQIFDTYHSPKNKEILPIVTFFSVVAIIFKGAIFYELVIWTLYYSYCCKNNERWSNDPNNLRQRKFLLELKQDILSGKMDYYNK